jgi:hypothetical protein
MGDGTVPVFSATAGLGTVGRAHGAAFCPLGDKNSKYKSHGFLLSDARVIDAVLKTLGGQAATVCPASASIPAVPAAPTAETSAQQADMRAVEVQTTGRVSVTDAEGKITGIGPDCVVVEELDCVTFEVTGNGAFLTIPEGSDYQVIVEDTGGEPFDLAALSYTPAADGDRFVLETYRPVENIELPDQGQFLLGNLNAPLDELEFQIDRTGERTSIERLDPPPSVPFPQYEQWINPATELSINDVIVDEVTGDTSALIDLKPLGDADSTLYYRLDTTAEWQLYEQPFEVDGALLSSLETAAGSEPLSGEP